MASHASSRATSAGHQIEDCPTCGSPVYVVTSDEGTSHYRSLYEFDVIVPLGELREERDRLRKRLGEFEKVLRLVAVGKRPDGTYNRSREACEQMAKEVLADGGF